MLSFTTTVTVTVTAKSSSHELDKKKFCKIFFEIKLEYPRCSIQLKNLGITFSFEILFVVTSRKSLSRAVVGVS